MTLKRKKYSSINSQFSPAILVLENKTVFKGIGLGYQGEATGEVCFNTSLTGYQEIISDPSYAGQIINFTFPHIGNVGANKEDLESEKIWTRGVIFNSEITSPSNYRSLIDLNKWLKKNKIVGITGLDQANESQFKEAKKFFSTLPQKHDILWNDGPNLKKLDNQLADHNLAPQELGKGRNVWYCMGYTYSRNEAGSVALHDCDITTYDKELLARLVYPVANPLFNYEFCKGYYPRVGANKLNGRVTRLLVTPLLKTFKKRPDLLKKIKLTKKQKKLLEEWSSKAIL